MSDRARPGSTAPSPPSGASPEAARIDEDAGRLERVARWLPAWMGSVRFRLTALYSLVLFGLAALLLGGIYLALATQLDDEPMSRDIPVSIVQPGPGGEADIEPGALRITFETFEQQVNERSLQLLRAYSFGALGLLFLASLVVGWIVAGRVLAPIDRITSVARDIQATDLSRRIDLRGPPDELKNLADTFDEMLQRIDDAFESQRRFVHEASHELRNPLAVMRTNLEVALADPDADADELREAATVVQRSANRMSYLVEDLLVHVRHGSGEARAAEPCELESVTAEIAEEFAMPAAERELSIETSRDAGVWVTGDRLGLRQAVANLVGNAVRLAPTGTRIRLDCQRVRADDGGTWAALSVADEGPGIPAGERERIFDRFWRGEPRQGQPAGRSGLGLTIVRQVVTAHRGRVEVRANDAGGSTFVIWLPARDAPD